MELFSKLRKRHSKEARKGRGQEASYLLNHYLTKEFLEKAEYELFSRWRSAQSSAEREQVDAELRGLQSFVHYLANLEAEKKMIEKQEAQSAANS